MSARIVDVGPGLWFGMHSEAIKYDEDNKQVEGASRIRLSQKDIPCLRCQKHMSQYLARYPPEKYFEILIDGRRLGLFFWTWMFHNDVNRRLGKSEMSLPDALKIYDSTAPICSRTCG